MILLLSLGRYLCWWTISAGGIIHPVVRTSSVLLVEDPEKATDLPQITDQLYHILLDFHTYVVIMYTVLSKQSFRNFPYTVARNFVILQNFKHPSSFFHFCLWLY